MRSLSKKENGALEEKHDCIYQRNCRFSFWRKNDSRKPWNRLWAEYSNLRFAVLSEDVQAIAKTPGIGKKTAQKLILELKDKFDLQEAFEQKLAGNQAAAAVRQAGEPDAFQDAVQALTALGYSGTEALQAVKKVEITEGMDSEAVLKAALKHMF